MAQQHPPQPQSQRVLHQGRSRGERQGQLLGHTPRLRRRLLQGRLPQAPCATSSAREFLLRPSTCQRTTAELHHPQHEQFRADDTIVAACVPVPSSVPPPRSASTSRQVLQSALGRSHNARHTRRSAERENLRRFATSTKTTGCSQESQERDQALRYARCCDVRTSLPSPYEDALPM